MNKRVLYVGIWNYKLDALIQFLKEKEYDNDLVNELEFVLNESNKTHKERV